MMLSRPLTLPSPSIPHPFPFSRVEKGKLEPPLSTGGEGRG